MRTCFWFLHGFSQSVSPWFSKRDITKAWHWPSATILLKGFGKAKVDELQGMVAVVLVHLGAPVAQGLGGEC